MGVAAQVLHHFEGYLIGIDLADVQLLKGLLVGIAGDQGGGGVEYQDVALFVCCNDSVHGTGDQVAQHDVRALQFFFDTARDREIEIHADEGLDFARGDNRVAYRQGILPRAFE